MSDLIPAVEYVRMSTEGQQLSIPFQQAAIRLHATQRGYEILRTFEDAGRSGLYLKGRESLMRLLAEVQGGQADFKAILVYDVSRWGRFQDTDESAHYEYLCRMAGIQVIYCAEPFPNDHGPITTVLKAIKRAMAAEFSRELAVKTHGAMSRLVAQGYLPGGSPGYGLRRMLIGPDGKPKGILAPGVPKSARTDRIILVPGPPHEIETIHRIYRMFLKEGLAQTAIAAILNSEGVSGAMGRRWNEHSVRYVLQSERYVGRLVFARTISNLRRGLTQPGRAKNDPVNWVRGALPDAIVSPEEWQKVREMPNLRGLIYRDDEDMLEPLRRILKKYGYLSSNLIKFREGIPSPATLRKRFGSVRAAFARVGYTCQYKPEVHMAVMAKAQDITKQIKDAVETRGRVAIWTDRRKSMKLDNGRTLAVSIARYEPTRRHPELRWASRTKRRNPPDYTVIARLQQNNTKVIDYFCLPRAAAKPYNCFDQRGFYDDYRCTTFDQMIERLLSR